MNTNAYNDTLIQIDDTPLVVKNLMPDGKDKIVTLKDLETVTAKQPSPGNGKWRLSGFGDFRTWFATDLMRFKRDKIFIVKITTRWWRIGFTAEDSGRVEHVVMRKQLLCPERVPNPERALSLTDHACISPWRDRLKTANANAGDKRAGS